MSKKRFTLGALLIVFLIIVAGIVTLSVYGKADETISIDELNANKSQVLVTGTGYQLNYEQEKVIEEAEEKKEESKAKQDSNEVAGAGSNAWNEAAPGSGSGSGSGTGSGGGGQEEGGGGEIDTSMLPNINTDLVDGSTYNGTYKGFWVTATDFKGRSISRENFNVSINGTKTYSSGSDDNKANYSFDLQDGANTVSIIVTDKYGNKTTRNLTIYGNTSGEQELEGYVTLSLSASNVGLGYLVGPQQVEVYKNEKLANVIVRFLKNNNFGYSNSGTIGYGFYLKKIYRTGITNSWHIPSNIQQGLDDIGASYMGYDVDSLGEFDFYEKSGWMFEYNGEILDTGFSSVIALDGDTIDIWFTTYLGRDRGGQWK